MFAASPQPPPPSVLFYFLKRVINLLRAMRDYSQLKLHNENLNTCQALNSSFISYSDQRVISPQITLGKLTKVCNCDNKCIQQMHPTEATTCKHLFTSTWETIAFLAYKLDDLRLDNKGSKQLAPSWCWRHSTCHKKNRLTDPLFSLFFHSLLFDVNCVFSTK